MIPHITGLVSSWPKDKLSFCAADRSAFGCAAISPLFTHNIHGISHSSEAPPTTTNMLRHPKFVTRCADNGNPTAGPSFVPAIYRPTASPPSLSAKCSEIYRMLDGVTTPSPIPRMSRRATSHVSPEL